MNTSHPIFILAFFCTCIAVAEWLVKKPVLKYFGEVLIIIILTATAANTGLIPSVQQEVPLYDGILGYVAPLSIFLLMLNVRLRTIRRAGPSMLLMYLLGALATLIGVVAGYVWLRPAQQLGAAAAPLAGMFTATYVGGSINFNAVALHYNITKEGNLYAAANAVDNIWTAVWIIATVVIPNFLNRYFPRRNRALQPAAPPADGLPAQSSATSAAHLAVIGALALGSLFLAKNIAAAFPTLPFILVLTTIALVLGQLPVVQALKGSKMLGNFSIYLFFAVIGAYCDVHALAHNSGMAWLILQWISIIIILHGLLVYGMAALLKIDWDVASIASQAGIGGPTTALSNARVLHRDDLELPGVLAGTLGYAIGTYVGILVAELIH